MSRNLKNIKHERYEDRVKIYHRLHMTFLTLGMVEDTLDEVAAVLEVVHFRDHKDVGGFLVRRDFRMDVIGDLAGAVDGVLVVTTKENIRNVSLDVPISRYLPQT